MKLRREKLSHSILACTLVLALTAGCVEQGDDEPEDSSNTTSDTGGSGSSGGSSGGTTTTTEASLNKGLYIKVDKAWYDNASEFESVDSCSVDLGAATGTTTNCTVSLDEGTLFFSSLKMTIGTADSTTCPILIYYPMYYMRAANTTSSCNSWEYSESIANTTPQEYNCYNGPATKISGFPSKVGNTFLSITTQESSFTADSAFSLDQSTNRWMVSNITDPTTAQAGYVANSLQGYSVECRDYFFDLQYKINMTIEDNDGTSDHFSNWL